MTQVEDPISPKEAGQGSARPMPAAPAALRLINTGLSADRKHVHLHFIAGDGQVVTVQLETEVAVRFYQSLGGVLGQINGPDERSLRWH
jgi:hypothetical protein